VRLLIAAAGVIGDIVFQIRKYIFNQCAARSTGVFGDWGEDLAELGRPTDSRQTALP
jgi:hypothetical protein